MFSNQPNGPGNSKKDTLQTKLRVYLAEKTQRMHF